MKIDEHKGLRVLVCGGRDFDNVHYVYHILDKIHVEKGIDTVIDGAARGADSHACEWARINRVKNERFPADWWTHGKSAGFIRNRQMLEEGKPDLVVAFSGGKGTAMMVKLAFQAGICLMDLREE